VIYQNRIIDSLPALARLQIDPEQAMALPPWLFWRLVSADQKDRVLQEQAMTQSVGMGMGGYPKDLAEKIHSNWKRILTVDDPREPKNGPRRMDRSRKAAWDLIGKVMGATGATKGGTHADTVIKKRSDRG
jgi:hypothetical protein